MTLLWLLLVTFALPQVVHGSWSTVGKCEPAPHWTVSGRNPVRDLTDKGRITIVTILESKEREFLRYTLANMNNLAHYYKEVVPKNVSFIVVNQLKDNLSGLDVSMFPHITILSGPDDDEMFVKRDTTRWHVLVFDACGARTFKFKFVYTWQAFLAFSNKISYSVRHYKKPCCCHIPRDICPARRPTTPRATPATIIPTTTTTTTTPTTTTTTTTTTAMPTATTTTRNTPVVIFEDLDRDVFEDSDMSDSNPFLIDDETNRDGSLNSWSLQSDRESSYIDKMTTHVGKTTSHTDKTPSYPDKTTSYIDKPTSNAKKTASYTDKTTSNADKTTSYNGKTTSNADKTTSNADKTTSYANKITSHADKTTTSYADKKTFSHQPIKEEIVDDMSSIFDTYTFSPTVHPRWDRTTKVKKSRYDTNNFVKDTIVDHSFQGNNKINKMVAITTKPSLPPKTPYSRLEITDSRPKTPHSRLENDDLLPKITDSRPGKNDARPGISHSVTGISSTKSSESHIFDARPEKMHSGIESVDSVPEITDSVPGMTGAVPGITDSRPGITDSRPEITDSVPGMTGAVPGITDSRPGITDSRPGITESVPGITDVVPGITDSGPGMTDSVPGITDSVPGITDSGPGITDSGPGIFDARPEKTKSGSESTESGLGITTSEDDIFDAIDYEPQQIHSGPSGPGISATGPEVFNSGSKTIDSGPISDETDYVSSGVSKPINHDRNRNRFQNQGRSDDNQGRPDDDQGRPDNDTFGAVKQSILELLASNVDDKEKRKVFSEINKFGSLTRYIQSRLQLKRSESPKNGGLYKPPAINSDIPPLYQQKIPVVAEKVHGEPSPESKRNWEQTTNQPIIPDSYEKKPDVQTEQPDFFDVFPQKEPEEEPQIPQKPQEPQIPQKPQEPQIPQKPYKPHHSTSGHEQTVDKSEKIIKNPINNRPPLFSQPEWNENTNEEPKFSSMNGERGNTKDNEADIQSFDDDSSTFPVISEVISSETQKTLQQLRKGTNSDQNDNEKLTNSRVERERNRNNQRLNSVVQSEPFEAPFQELNTNTDTNTISSSVYEQRRDSWEDDFLLEFMLNQHLR